MHCGNTDKTIPSYFAWPSEGNDNLVKLCSIGRSNKFIVVFGPMPLGFEYYIKLIDREELQFDY